jgi:hypothetical protein
MEIVKNDLLAYLDNLYLKTKDVRLANSKIRSDILEKMNKACKICSLSFSDLLQKLDFKPKDLTIEALEAFLAELRSIFWLRDFGFSDIAPFQAGKFPQPDFIAKFIDKTCAIEVFCLTEAHEQQKDSELGVYKNFDPQFDDSKFGRDFISKANNDKKKQLDSTKADLKILLCVINSTPIVALNTKENFSSHMELLFNKLNWGNTYYLGFLAGETNGVLCNTIYPKLARS